MGEKKAECVITRMAVEHLSDVARRVLLEDGFWDDAGGSELVRNGFAVATQIEFTQWGQMAQEEYENTSQ